MNIGRFDNYVSFWNREGSIFAQTQVFNLNLEEDFAWKKEKTKDLPVFQVCLV